MLSGFVLNREFFIPYLRQNVPGSRRKGAHECGHFKKIITENRYNHQLKDQHTG